MIRGQLLVLLLVAVTAGGCGTDDTSQAPAAGAADEAEEHPEDDGREREADDDGRGDGSGDEAAAEVVEEHWFADTDSFDRPIARWAGVVENTGGEPVYVGVEVEAFDDDGASLGTSSTQYPELLRPGNQMPFSLAVGRLAAEPSSLSSSVGLDSLPDFRAERVGLATFTGEVTGVSFEEDLDLVVTADVSAQNTGSVGSSPDLALAIYDDGGTLVGGGWAPAPADVVCPGERADISGEVILHPPPGFDTSSAEVVAHFFDAEVQEQSGAGC